MTLTDFLKRTHVDLQRSRVPTELGTLLSLHELEEDDNLERIDTALRSDPDDGPGVHRGPVGRRVAAGPPSPTPHS